MDWYDKQGNMMFDMDDIESKRRDPTYKVVRREKLRGGKKVISTVWVGLDHSYDGDLLIFETMIFNRYAGQINYADAACKRYATEAEAIAGHAAMRQHWQYNRRQRRRYGRKS